MSWRTLSAAGGIVEKDGELLMVRQRRPYGVHWEFASGYYEAGESYEECAAREVLEETGVDVVVHDLVCTLVWERPDDRRRNLLAFFHATPVDPARKPRPQTVEDIEDARYVDPDALATSDLHPLERPILERWWRGQAKGFHLHAEVTVNADGSHSYRFRSDAS